MVEYAELNKQLKFFVKASPGTFLFIKVSVRDSYEYVIDELQKVTDLNIVDVAETEDIVERVKNMQELAVIYVNPASNDNLLKRLDYLRDALYALHRLLVFIFFEEQYNDVLLKYPDFAAYSTLFLDYSSKLAVPFTLIFSSEGLSEGRSKVFSLSDIIQENRQSSDKISFIYYGINKLNYKKMNVIELRKLDDAVSELLFVNKDKVNSESVEIMLECVKTLYSREQFAVVSELITGKKESVACIVLKYLEALYSKEQFELLQKNLINLCAFWIGRTSESLDIEAINILCLAGLIDSSQESLKSFNKYLMDRVAKFLVPYYCHINNEDSIKKALRLSTLCLSRARSMYLQEKYSSDNLLAESLNDNAILNYMVEHSAKSCIYVFEFFKHLTLNYEHQFVYCHNKVVLLLLSEKYDEATAECDRFLRSYGQFEGSGMAYTRICLMKNWIDGMFSRHLQKAIESNMQILREHRQVFPENHYSIAEIHFCNAYMYYELRNVERSKHCLVKAENILNQNHSVRLERLKGAVNAFAVKLNK